MLFIAFDSNNTLISRFTGTVSAITYITGRDSHADVSNIKGVARRSGALFLSVSVTFGVTKNIPTIKTQDDRIQASGGRGWWRR